MKSCVVGALLFFALPLSGHADITRSNTTWTVSPKFKKSDDARTSLSGAICVPGTGVCLAVNDEKKYAQFFKIDRNTIQPTSVIRLLPDELDGVEMDEIDAEGAAYAAPVEPGLPAYIYVTGSHGLPRSKPLQPSRFFLFRFPVDTVSGLPTFAFDDDSVASAVERTSVLRETIKMLPEIGKNAETDLDRNGVTIEGIAVKDKNLLMGFRSPCTKGNAYIVSIPMADFFTGKVPIGETPVALPLGDNAGIRDIARVRNGVLILSGRSNDSEGDGKQSCGKDRSSPAVVASIWFWSGKAGDTPKLMGRLPGVTGADKAETLLVLDESESTYRILVMFDGRENGGPLEFNVKR